MDSTTTPSNESILSAEDIHRDNLTAFRVGSVFPPHSPRGDGARFLLNRGLLALYESGLYRALDYPSIIKYADVNFGYCVFPPRSPRGDGQLCFPPSVPPRGRSTVFSPLGPPEGTA